MLLPIPILPPRHPVITWCELLEDLVAVKPDGIKRFTDLITYVADRPGHDVRYAIDARTIQRELR